MEKIKNRIIVSCQRSVVQKLHSKEQIIDISSIAIEAFKKGASALELSSIEDIKSVRKKVWLPLIGILPKIYPNSEVYHTPSYQEFHALAQMGVDILAFDATLRPRPYGEKLEEILYRIREEFPQIYLMGEISTLDEAIYAETLQINLISTALRGHTKQTQGYDVSDHHFSFIRKALQVIKTPLIAAGKIETSQQAQIALSQGAYSVMMPYRETSKLKEPSLTL